MTQECWTQWRGCASLAAPRLRPQHPSNSALKKRSASVASWQCSSFPSAKNTRPKSATRSSLHVSSMLMKFHGEHVYVRSYKREFCSQIFKPFSVSVPESVSIEEESFNSEKDSYSSDSSSSSWKILNNAYLWITVHSNHRLYINLYIYMYMYGINFFSNNCAR